MVSLLYYVDLGDRAAWLQNRNGARGGTRTRTPLGQGILSPLCLPFHHPGANFAGTIAEAMELASRRRACAERLQLFRRLGVFSLEALDPALGVDQFRGAGVERVAVRAGIHVHFLARGAGLEDRATGATDRALDVFRMDFSFHVLGPRGPSADRRKGGENSTASKFGKRDDAYSRRFVYRFFWPMKADAIKF